jgi:uncharacterized membrane protein YphA (DoxX/SURF4 family)
MKKRNRIIYWIATIWLSLGMLSSGVVQLLHLKAEVDLTERLGYPAYFLTLLGAWKILGVLAVLMPRLPLIKEWAYAGFVFVMTGAIISHIASGDAINEMFGPLLLLILTIVSWYFRPAERRITSLQNNTIRIRQTSYATT